MWHRVAPCLLKDRQLALLNFQQRQASAWWRGATRALLATCTLARSRFDSTRAVLLRGEGTSTWPEYCHVKKGFMCQVNLNERDDTLNTTFRDYDISQTPRVFSSVGSISQQHGKLLEFDWNRRYMPFIFSIDLNYICSASNSINTLS